MKHFRPKVYFVKGLLLLVLSLGILVSFAHAQQTTTPGELVITGNIESINDELTEIVVGGLTVDLSQLDPAVEGLAVGVIVQVTGVFSDGVIIATHVEIIVSTPTPTLAVTQAPTHTPTPTLELTTIPMITGTPTDDDGTIIVIEGPITEININVITIFDIDIWVTPDDPILTDLEIGDIIRVIGDVDFDGDVIIIVAVNITIINVIIIDNPPSVPDNCKISKNGKIKCKKSS